MFSLQDSPTKEEILSFLSHSASFGNLGMFIGAGFSKAVINIDGIESALSWSELLEKCAEQMKVDYDAITKTGISYPQIASDLCGIYSKNKNCTYEEALKVLKDKISDLTSLYPTREKRKEFSEYLEKFAPDWIITTNYDLVIESLLTGKSIALSPQDQLIAEAETIPVFHLHGVRTAPENLALRRMIIFRCSDRANTGKLNWL